jgi:hypothetical protein
VSSELDKARAEVVKLAEAERRLSEKHTVKAADLEAIAGGLGQATLAAELAGEEVDPASTRRARELRTELEAIDSAIQEARRTRQEAIRSAWKAEAEGLRQRAGKKRDEAADRQKQTDKLLAQLREWEGCEYRPGPKPEYTGAMLSRPLMYGLDAAVSATAALQVEAGRLDAEASELEARKVPRSGLVTGATVAELFAAIMADAFRLGPTMAEIAAWTVTVEAKIREPWAFERWSEHRPTDDNEWDRLPRRFSLAWQELAIQPEHSGLELFEWEGEHVHGSEMGGALVKGSDSLPLLNLGPMFPGR